MSNKGKEPISYVSKEFRGAPWPVLQDRRKVNIQVDKDLRNIKSSRPMSDTAFKHTSCTYAELKELNRKLMEESNQ